MDLSKLPRLSDTPPPPQEQAPQAAFASSPPVSGIVWFNIIVGLLLILLGRNFGHFLLSKATGQPFHTGFDWGPGERIGEVPYFELAGYTAHTEAGMFLFGVAVLLEAGVVIMLAKRPASASPFLRVTLVLTFVATLWNLYVVALLLKAGMLPTMSLLAVAFGGYIVLDQWRLLKQHRA